MRLYLTIMALFCFANGPVTAQSHHPQAFLESIKGHKDEGKQIYEHFCASCHAPSPMIQLGAPKAGDSPVWAARLNQGVDTVLRHTYEGINAMPPRGGCFECTDEQLVLAIITMVSEKNKKVLLNQLKVHKKSTK